MKLALNFLTKTILIMQSNNEFEGRKKKIEGLLKKLKRAKQSYVQYENGKEIRSLDKHIQYMLINEQMYWKQRSKDD